MGLNEVKWTPACHLFYNILCIVSMVPHSHLPLEVRLMFSLCGTWWWLSTCQQRDLYLKSSWRWNETWSLISWSTPTFLRLYCGPTQVRWFRQRELARAIHTPSVRRIVIVLIVPCGNHNLEKIGLLSAPDQIWSPTKQLVYEVLVNLLEGGGGGALSA